MDRLERVAMMSTESVHADWNFPTKIHFGPNRSQELPLLLKQHRLRRPLLITDPGVKHLAQPISDQCRQAGFNITIFDQVIPNPDSDTVYKALAIYKDSGCDSVIALGGGSSIDAGKSVALLSGQTGHLWDYEDIDDNYLRIDPNGIAPCIAVPTTAGSGAEVGRVALITDNDTKTKRFIFHPQLIPKVVIADPQLTLDLPPHLTAATGMDALSHNIEALCSPLFHPAADGIAHEGVHLVFTYLKQAYTAGSDLKARQGMLAASILGATAFQKGLGAVHSLSHPLGGLYGLHHGLTNAVLLPYVLKYNRPAIEDKITSLARYLELSPPTFDSFLNHLTALQQSLNLPTTLKEIGVKEADLTRLALQATKDPSALTNPLPLTQAAHEQLYRAAFYGDDKLLTGGV